MFIFYTCLYASKRINSWGRDETDVDSKKRNLQMAQTFAAVDVQNALLLRFQESSSPDGSDLSTEKLDPLAGRNNDDRGYHQTKKSASLKVIGSPRQDGKNFESGRTILFLNIRKMIHPACQKF